MNEIPPPFRKWDGLFLGLIVTIALITMFFMTADDTKTGSPKQIVITDWQGKVKACDLPQSGSKDVNVNGPLGTTIITLSHDGGRFASSPCPNHTCINHGIVKALYDSAACIPNKIIITVQIIEPQDKLPTGKISKDNNEDNVPLDGITQ